MQSSKPWKAESKPPSWIRRRAASAKRHWLTLTGPAPLRWLPEGVRRRALVLRVLRASWRDLVHGHLSLQAMSLVYTTLLSLVPLLAVSFSVLKGFGVHNQVQPLLYNVLRPLGWEKAHELADQIIGFVDNVKVGLLGGVGLLMLIYTVLLLMQKIEDALNYTWHIKRGRSLRQTFAVYLSVLLIGPLLVFGAISVISALASDSLIEWVTHQSGMETVIAWGGQFVPYVILVVAFTFIYMMVPNTGVRFKPALIGAAISAALWELWGWMFAAFLANSAGYAIYAAFATLFIFMFWLYGSWLILLLGSSIACYIQHPQYATVEPDALKLSARAREIIAIAVMREIANHFKTGAPGWTVAALAKRIDAPDPAVEWTVCALLEGGLLFESGEKPTRLMLAKDPSVVTLAEMVAVLRDADSTGRPSRLKPPEDPQANGLIEESERARDVVLRGRTIRSLIDAPDTPPPGDAPPAP
ncbi:YhjD/YihY/BrkB family envelope integrity protein [Emcibacter sp. SYSU 3D8]|uniref:YihY/virulence factor BrkB family protein n=1 Tax=Emcibacter sp. SYSU 3D8 TaxID=3133969 RepID=UPI0031FEECA7